MPKIKKINDINGSKSDFFRAFPDKMYVCHCEQCRGIKDKTKSINLKRRVARLLNKRRRNLSDHGIVYYWA